MNHECVAIDRLHQKRRPLTDLQLLVAMGWRRSSYKKLKVFSLRRFLGNSMHLANVFTVTACCLACTEFPEETSAQLQQQGLKGSLERKSLFASLRLVVGFYNAVLHVILSRKACLALVLGVQVRS